MSFVVDSSAIVKQFLLEPERDALKLWLREARRQPDGLLAPSLLRYEVGNVIALQAKRGARWNQEQRHRILEESMLGVRFVEPTGVEAFTDDLTFYDAAYLALANAIEAPLVTYDDRMAEVARGLGVDVRAPGR